MGQELIKFGVDDSVKITLGIGNKDLSHIKKGMETEISIDSIPGKIYKGTVNKILPSVSSNSGLTLVEINLNNKEHLLKKDMFARIKIIVDKAKNTIVVPKEFINTDNNNNKYLYIVKDKIVLKTIVTTGLESDDMIEINSGVNENDIVTSANISYLKDKSKILIWNDIKGGEKNDIN